jgi:hypothetical protein
MTTSVSSGGMILTGESRVPGDKVALVTCNVTLGRWCNHCCHKEASVRSVYCWAACHCQRYKYRLLHKNGFMGSLCRRQSKVLTCSCEGSLCRRQSKVLTYSCEVKCPIFFCLILTKFGVCRQISVTVPSMKIVCSLSSGSRADTCGQTDGQTDCCDDEANRSFSRMCERDYKARPLKTKTSLNYI